MFKIITFVFMVIACVCAKPKPLVAYSAPIVAAPLTTSSAIVSSGYYGSAAPYVAAYPYVSAYSAPYAAPYAAPYTAPYAPYAAYTTAVL